MHRDNDSDVHRRRSIRLPGYNYSEEGWYFVTICAQGHRCVFGQIKENQMCLNAAGLMMEMWWCKLASKFPLVEKDEYVVISTES